MARARAMVRARAWARDRAGIRVRVRTRVVGHPLRTRDVRRHPWTTSNESKWNVWSRDHHSQFV